MNLGIGDEKTREDHRGVADQLYAAYAQGRDLRRLVAIVGEEALSEADRRYLKFADDFEDNFVNQRDENRDIERTLGISWDLLSGLSIDELKRVKREHIAKYHPKAGEEEAGIGAEPEEPKPSAPAQTADTDAKIAEKLKKHAEEAAAKAEAAEAESSGDGEDKEAEAAAAAGAEAEVDAEITEMAAEEAAEEETVEAEAP